MAKTKTAHETKKPNEPKWYPLEVVAVPREVLEQWSRKPYAEMRTAAEQGIDGLTIRSGLDIRVPGLAIFRKPQSSEQGFAEGTALLYSLGW